MSQWRREALQWFPELHREIAEAESIHMVWYELRKTLLEPAYQKNPPDLETISRVFSYADWSLKHRSIDVRTAVVISYYEALPDDPLMRRDMPRWISQETFDMLQFAWEYTTKQPFADFRKEFLDNKVRLDKEKNKQRQQPVFGRRSKE